MDEPSFFKDLLSGVLTATLTVSLFIAGIMFTRSAKRQSDQEFAHRELESRVRVLERESVTHDDLRRLETKIDESHKQITDRLDRILERQLQ